MPDNADDGVHEGEFYAELGALIREKRMAADVTQEALAEAVGLSRTSIVNIEAGRQGVAIHRLVDIAYALSVPFTTLVPLPDEDAGTAVTSAVLRRRVQELEAIVERVRKAVS